MQSPLLPSTYTRPALFCPRWTTSPVKLAECAFSLHCAATLHWFCLAQATGAGVVGVVGVDAAAAEAVDGGKDVDAATGAVTTAAAGAG